MNIRSLIFAAFAAVAGCSEPYEPSAKFDSSAAEFARRAGSGGIEGQAFLRQRGGDVVTCAGSGVLLLPAVAYTDEIFVKATGSPSGGVASMFAPSPKSFDERLKPYAKVSQCDAQGNFQFTKLSPGTYWIATEVTWTVGNNIFPEGGVVAKRVTIGSGITRVVVTS